MDTKDDKETAEPTEKRKRAATPPMPEPPTHYRFLVNALGSHTAGQVVSAEELGTADIARYLELGAITPCDAPTESEE